ncbi:MAG: RagB/SusD family nutrient uptake outer membrane protein [Tannerella sp.]|jgi:hypothetical protein|nr:RagB/SusD family nutrient uptake outer membrane protein [Tannerella sp.]
MKKVFYFLTLIAFVALVSFTFNSCKDDTDDVVEEPEVPVVPEPEPEEPGPVLFDIIKTNAEAEALGNAVYPPLQRLSSSFSFLIELPTESTISFEGPEDRGAPVISRLEQAPKTGFDVPHDYPDKGFQRLYESIGNSNIVIAKIDSSRVNDNFTQDTKDRIRARVKFTRALSYFYLVQLYGEVPLKLKQADASITTRASIEEIYTQIVKDLTEAEADLPAYDSNKAVPSKGAANAILSRVYLTWGQNPLTLAQVDAIKDSKTDPAHSVDNAKLEKALEYANKVVNSGQYSLLDDYNRNFGIVGQNGDEHIYTIHHDGDAVDNVLGQSNHQTHCTFTNRFTDLTADFHIGPADPTVLDRFDPADKRKLLSYTTRLFDSEDGNKRYDWAFPVTTPIYGKWIHRSGYVTTGDIPTIERAGGSSAAQPNNINRIEIRYAEVLLIKAEALFFLNRANEALPLINQLRTRAFGDNSHNLSSLTKEDLFKEWELELTFEQKRWTNLTRWKTYIQTIQTVQNFEYYKEIYKTPESIIAEFGDAIDGVTVNAPFYAKAYKHLHAKYDNVKGKHYRFPIPQLSGVDLGITQQNPGY